MPTDCARRARSGYTASVVSCRAGENIARLYDVVSDCIRAWVRDENTLECYCGTKTRCLTRCRRSRLTNSRLRAWGRHSTHEHIPLLIVGVVGRDCRDSDNVYTSHLPIDRGVVGPQQL